MTNNCFCSSEKQSIASKNRKNINSEYIEIGKKPDAMLAMYINNIKYELMYVETSQICCTSRKRDDDHVKLWRQCNDGLSWVYGSCIPAKNRFCLIGIQIHGL
jgi:hypothetical protein